MDSELEFFIWSSLIWTSEAGMQKDQICLESMLAWEGGGIRIVLDPGSHDPIFLQLWSEEQLAVMFYG